MPKLTFPEPQAITHSQASAALQQVLHTMPGLPATAASREAARELGVDYATFNKAMKSTSRQPISASKA